MGEGRDGSCEGVYIETPRVGIGNRDMVGHGGVIVKYGRCARGMAGATVAAMEVSGIDVEAFE